MANEMKRIFSLHEGGSKFYQMAAIEFNGRSALFKQWGPYGGSGRPSLGECQTQVEEFKTYLGAEHAMRSMQRKKEKRGYVEWEESKPKPLSKEEQLRGLFKATDWGQIVAHLFSNVKSARLVSDEPVVKPKPKEEKVDRGETWGTW